MILTVQDRLYSGQSWRSLWYKELVVEECVNVRGEGSQESKSSKIYWSRWGMRRMYQCKKCKNSRSSKICWSRWWIRRLEGCVSVRRAQSLSGLQRSVIKMMNKKSWGRYSMKSRECKIFKQLICLLAATILLVPWIAPAPPNRLTAGEGVAEMSICTEIEYCVENEEFWPMGMGPFLWFCRISPLPDFTKAPPIYRNTR